MPKLSVPRYRSRSHGEQTGPRFIGDHSLSRSLGSRSLRVVTFNIRHSRFISRALDLFEQSEALQDLDILALQEMDEGGVDQIARRFGLNYVYYPAIVHPIHGRNFGNALLSPWRISEDQKIFLPHHGRVDQMQRIAVAATFTMGRRRVRAYSLHLGTVVQILPRQRKEQVETVLSDADRFTCPIIMVGDMNARGIGRFLERKGYLWATKSVRSTISLFAWDHIFLRGFEEDPGIEVGVVRDNRKASDHKPVWMVLRLDGKKGPALPGRRSLLPTKILPSIILGQRQRKKLKKLDKVKDSF